MKTSNVILIGIISLFFVNCGNSSVSDNKEWSQEYKKDFLRGCINSAKKSYEAREMEPNREEIESHCICIGKFFEKKYSMEDMDTVSKETMKKGTYEAIKGCK